MTNSTDLEHRYRRLLALYPKALRRERVQEILSVLIPGAFGQTIAFGAMNTAVGIAANMRMGFLERFRALPMARSAVLTARTLADLARNVLVVLLMTAVGFAVGFHAHGGPLGLLAALALARNVQ
jgi:hypothetical protein